MKHINKQQKSRQDFYDYTIIIREKEKHAYIYKHLQEHICI